MERDDFFPTLERARAELHHVTVKQFLHLFGGTDLLDDEGVEVKRLAAVVVNVSALVRTPREHEVELSERREGEQLREPPPLPERWVEASHDVVLESGPVGTCSRCDVLQATSPTPGQTTCARCHGKGKLRIHHGRHHHDARDLMAIVDATIDGSDAIPNPDILPCPDCAGLGVRACDTCEGTGRSVRVRMRELSDRPHAFRHVYVPSLRVGLEAKLDARISSFELPDALLHVIDRDGDPDGESSPYREASVTTDDAVGAFAFEGRVARARKTIAETLGDGRVVDGGADVYAWPLLVLTGESAEAVVLVDPAGKLEVLVEEDG